MPTNPPALRHRPADSEKITINLGYVDLGHVDLMVKDGFYSDRTDFIRTAIRNQLDRHADVVRQSVSRKALELGLRHYSRADLEAARTRGELLHINVLGLASIAHDVTAELARAPIASVTVLDALQASSEVKAALALPGGVAAALVIWPVQNDVMALVGAWPLSVADSQDHR